MSNTPSNMIPLGTLSPDFRLFDTVSQRYLALDQLKGRQGTVIFFICNHCPFVIHVNEELVRIGNDYKDSGISFVAISSNDVINYPQDGPEQMQKVAKNSGYPFPYLYDESQEVARSFDAACTPDTYVFDDQLKLVYRGQIDDSRPGNGLDITGVDLRKTLDCLLDHKEISKNQRPSIGCNIKWKQ